MMKRKFWYISAGLVVLFLVIVLIFLRTDVNKIQERSWQGVEFVEFDMGDDIHNFKYAFDQVIDDEWIDDSTLEIRMSISLVCECEEVTDKKYKIGGGKIIVSYDKEVDDERDCADCSFPVGHSLKINNLTKANYEIELVGPGVRK
jgi:hypothetical protein